MNDSLHQKGCDSIHAGPLGPKTCAEREPERRSPARSAAKAERSECRGGTLLTRVRVILGLRGASGRVDENKLPTPIAFTYAG